MRTRAVEAAFVLFVCGHCISLLFYGHWQFLHVVLRDRMYMEPPEQSYQRDHIPRLAFSTGFSGQDGEEGPRAHLQNICEARLYVFILHAVLSLMVLTYKSAVTVCR